MMLQVTKAKLGDHVLEDRVDYVVQSKDGPIGDAYSQGDPRGHEEFDFHA